MEWREDKDEKKGIRDRIGLHKKWNWKENELEKKVKFVRNGIRGK